MTKRLALSPAVGLFAGLSVVSYGAVSMLLTGVQGARQASVVSCSSSTTSSSNALASSANAPDSSANARAHKLLPPPPPRLRMAAPPRARTAARIVAQHPAGRSVLLADVVKLVPVGAHAAAQAGASQGQVDAAASQTTSTSPSPLPSTQPSPSASPPPMPQPSPGNSATPQPSGLPQPGPAQSTSSQAPLEPGGPQQSANSSASPTTTPTSTATPTTTPTTPPPGTLCLTMQTLNRVSAVDPHTTVGFAIWIWLTSGTGGTAKITLSARPSSLRPTFSVCAPSGTSACDVGGLSAGQKVELQAVLAAPNRPSTHFTLTASATSKQASNSATASATVDIKPKNKPSPSSSPTPNAGDGATLPPYGAYGFPGGTTVPGYGIQPTGDLGSAFPQVSPSASAPGTGAAAHHGRTTRTVDLSAGLPLTVRLIGGQVIGLAVLAAAVTIAVARLSLRKQPARHTEDGPGS